MKKNVNDLIGVKYNNWTIVSFERVGVEYQKIVKAICCCGKIKDVYLSTIKSGGSKSCGCKLKRKITHGVSKSPLYAVWNGMKQRCLNPNVKQYKDYGGRGISVFQSWASDFTQFRYWAIRGGGYKKGLQLDRIDNNGNYEPTNCRFTTPKINNRNKSDNRRVMYNGEERLLLELCEAYLINYKTVVGRIKKGWSIEKSLNEPIKKY